jgi:hypothetical protein
LEPDSTPTAPDAATATYLRRHLRFGWWSLLCFLTLGIVLESLHGFKVGWYLDVANETRRFMWTLAHAHGVLLSLVNLAFAVSLPHLAADTVRLARLASPCLMGATFFLPGGFLLGGVVIHSGDPGLGILLVPVGALFLFIAVLLTARRATALRKPKSSQGADAAPTDPRRRESRRRRR